MPEKKSGFWSEFRNFAIKGDVLELAIAVVVGNAFGAVVNGLVADILTPFISFVTPGGTGDLQHFSVTLRGAVASNGTTTPALVVQYGSFIEAVINFFIITLCIFIVFKFISSTRERLFRRGEEAVPAHEKPPEERLLEEIRDLLRVQVGDEPNAPKPDKR